MNSSQVAVLSPCTHVAPPFNPYKRRRRRKIGIAVTAFVMLCALIAAWSKGYAAGTELSNAAKKFVAFVFNVEAEVSSLNVKLAASEAKVNELLERQKRIEAALLRCGENNRSRRAPSRGRPSKSVDDIMRNFSLGE